MAPASLLWLGMAMAVFVTANSVLRTYAGSGWWPTLLGALLLFSLGNVMMVRLMRESGLALAISISSVAQLVLISGVAFLYFGERPSGMQLAGMALGVVAVALIAWPQGGRG
jgi:drug/metabolite transporter (DMT)-like permease